MTSPLAPHNTCAFTHGSRTRKTVAASIQRLRLSKKGSVAVYNDETAPQAASEDDSPTSVAARHALSSIDATNLAPGMS